MKVAVVGAGRMGRAILARLVAGGYHPTVLTRRPETRAFAEAAGWACADTVEATVRDADVVISVVFDDEQLRAAALGDDGMIASMASGAVLVQHTTCDPATVTMLAEVGSPAGIEVLDAALSGNPRDIAAAQLTLWVGGNEGRLDQIRPLLQTYASPVMFVGPVGDGQRIKLINNALFVAQVGLAVDAVRLAETVGISEQRLLAAVQHGSGASRALSTVAWIGASDVGPRLSELMIKDVNAVQAVAVRSAADLGLIGDVLSSDVVETKVLCGGIAPSRSPAQRTAAPGSMKGAGG